jgi:hypothetical protein
MRFAVRARYAARLPLSTAVPVARRKNSLKQGYASRKASGAYALFVRFATTTRAAEVSVSSTSLTRRGTSSARSSPSESSVTITSWSSRSGASAACRPAHAGDPVVRRFDYDEIVEFVNLTNFGVVAGSVVQHHETHTSGFQ